MTKKQLEVALAAHKIKVLELKSKLERHLDLVVNPPIMIPDRELSSFMEWREVEYEVTHFPRESHRYNVPFSRG